MAQKLDARYQQSRMALIAAIRKLVSERPVSELSIKEVAEAAGVSRPTFYQHFDDVPALVTAACSEQMREIFSGIEGELKGTDAGYLRRVMHRFVKALYDDRAFSRNAVNGRSGMDIAQTTMTFLDDMMRDHVTGTLMGKDEVDHLKTSDRRFAITAGLVLMVFAWLNSDFTGVNEPDAMADRLTDTLFSLAGISE